MTRTSALMIFYIGLLTCAKPVAPDIPGNITVAPAAPSSSTAQTALVSNSTTSTSTATLAATTANPTYVYLYNKWCAPFFNTIPNASAYELLVNNAVRAACPTFAKGLPTQSDLWLVDAFGLSYYISYAQYVTIRAYVRSSNLSVPASVTADLCRAYVSQRASYVMFNVLGTVGTLPTSRGVQNIPNVAPAFAALIWTPFALISVVLSLLVLARVRKELEKMPSYIVYRAEIVCQLLSFLSFEYFSTTNLSVAFAFLAPFCFISPQVAVNIYVVESSFAYAYYAFWLLGATLKCAVAFERASLMYFPVFYHVHVNAQLVQKIFVLFIFAYFSLTIVFFVAMYASAFAGEQVYDSSSSTPSFYQITIFYVSALSVVGVLHVLCACLITVKLLRKLQIAAGAGDTHQQMVNRNIATFVVSTTLVSVVTYVWIMCQTVANVCGSTCLAVSVLAWFRSTAMTAGAALLVDMNIAICFVIQCICSSTYRKAASETVLQPIRGVCRRMLGLSASVTPVVPMGSSVASRSRTGAKSGAGRTARGSQSRVLTAM